MTGHRMLRGAALSLLLAATVGALFGARYSAAQSAGTANLLSSPAAWPTTGAVSGTTALALDPTALYLNPAGLATQDERSILIQHGLLQFDTNWDFAAVGYPIPGLGAVGLGMARLGTSGIDAYDAQNQPLGDLGYTETALAAGVALHAIGPLYAGATFKVLSQSLGDVSAAAPAVDLGLIYRPLRLKGAQVGFSAQNVIAGALDLGGAAPSIDRSFRFGAAGPEWRLGGASAIRAVADLARQGQEGMKPRVGVEFTRRGLGAVRAGINNGRPVLGVGVQYRRYGVDLSIAQGEVEMTRQFAVRVAFGEPVSEYETRRRAEYAKAALDSVRARRSAQFARDVARAGEMEKGGDWEGALVLWEVLHRERPEDASTGGRAERARAEIAATARAALDAETSHRLNSMLGDMARDALARGDVEEAAGLARALAPAGVRPTGVGGDSLASLEAAIAVARERAADKAVARADSLRTGGRLVAAAGDAALALRLRPDDPRATALWSELEGTLGKTAAEANVLSRRLESLTAVHEASQAFNEGRYTDAAVAVKRALAADPSSEEARAWKERIQRRLSTPKPELDARIKQLYIKGMEAFTTGDYKEALRNWEQILVIDPLNESARRNVLEARERMKPEARR